MGEDLFFILSGILTSLVPLAILGGIIYLVAKLVSNRGDTTEESTGVAIRRFFQYAIMLVMLVLASIGVAGLIDAAASAGSRITSDTTGTALSIAFVFVGLPVFVGLAIYTARRLRVDPHEQRSIGWAVYLTLALFGSLVTVMSLTGAILATLLEDRIVDRTLVIYAVVWAIVWVAHWFAAERKGDPQRLQPHILLGSAAGLLTTFTGVATGTAAVLQQIYEGLFRASIVDSGVEPLAAPLIILVVGVPVWWWYWFRHGRHLEHGPLWLTYALLLGVLAGAITVISGAGVAIFGILEWLLGDPSTTSPASHFAFLPGAVGAMTAGAMSWWYHGSLVGGRAERERTEVDRVYDYLLSGAGLVVAASGIATLMTVAIRALAGLGLTSFQTGNASAAALTLLIVGAPVWWRYWSVIRTNRDAAPDAELRSASRRIYIFLLFGVAGIVAVVNLIIIVFMAFSDILEGQFGLITLDSTAVPFALLITAGMVAGYHFVIFREDRAATHEVEQPTLTEAVVVGSRSDPIVGAIRSSIGASVTFIDAMPDRVHAPNVEEALAVLRDGHQQRVVVIPDDDGGYDVLTTPE